MCSSSLPAAYLRVGRSLAAYLTLLRLGFAVPLTLPSARWALTPPFHPCLRSSAGGLFSVALSVVWIHAQELPGNLAQWSPDFPRVDWFSNRDRPISGVVEIYVGCVGADTWAHLVLWFSGTVKPRGTRSLVVRSCVGFQPPRLSFPWRRRMRCFRSILRLPLGAR